MIHMNISLRAEESLFRLFDILEICCLDNKDLFSYFCQVCIIKCLSSFSQSALWKVKYNLFPSSNMAIVTHGSRLRMHGSCNNVPTGLKFRALV